MKSEIEGDQVNQEQPNVFISYARQDLDVAKRIFKDLKANGMEPWFDEESLLPGQNWRTEIDREIRNSRFFLPLLSTRSLTKEGTFRKK